MSSELSRALDAIEQEKGVSRDIIKEAVETALLSAYKKNYGTSQNVEVVFDENEGQISIYASKEVVDEVEDDALQISLDDALAINRAYEVGDFIKFEVTPTEYGRIAAQTAKQVITQRVREEERNIIYEEYIQYEDDLMTGTVERIDNRYIYVNLGRIEAVLSNRDQIPGEHYRPLDRIKVYVSKVENTTKGPQVFVSRTHPDLIKRLFEQEVPEIYNGDVEIKSIAREAGDRSKLAVYAEDDKIDPVGTCVGPAGNRVQAVVSELNGENMDIIEWDEDSAVFIANALKPAEVLDVIFLNEKSVIVVVPDHQLSLAIGKRGQNVRLAARLTGFKIDIKSESDMEELDIEALKAEAQAEEAAQIAAEEAAKAEAPDELESDQVVEEELVETTLDSPEDDVTDIQYEDGQLSPEQAEDMIELSEPSDEEIYAKEEEVQEEVLDEIENLDDLEESEDI